MKSAIFRAVQPVYTSYDYVHLDNLSDIKSCILSALRKSLYVDDSVVLSILNCYMFSVIMLCHSLRIHQLNTRFLSCIHLKQINVMKYANFVVQYNAMQCNAMQCNAMQCNAMQCNAMQCNAMQCNAMQCNAMQCNKTLLYRTGKLIVQRLS